MSGSPPVPDARAATRLGWLRGRVATGARALPHLAIAAVATFPLVLTPLTRLIGHEDVDVWNHAWGPWWFYESLSSGALPWRTDLLAAPNGGVLWYIDPIGATIGAGLVPLIGTIGAYNLAIFVQVALASVAARRLAVALGATPAASWVAAIGVSASPYLLSEIHNGVSEAVGVPWAVFALVAGRHALAPSPSDGATLRRWAVAGVWLGFTALGTWYYALGAATVLAAWALIPADDETVGAWRRAIVRRMVGLVVAGAIAAVIVVPVFALIRASIVSPDAIVNRGEASTSDRELLLGHNALDPLAFFVPGGFQSVDLAAQGEAFLHSSYLGIVAIALAAYARRPRALAAAIPALVLSLGPYLYVGGAWVIVGDARRVALPFRLLHVVLPDAAATHAQRVGFPGIALVAAVAAVGASRLTPRAVVAVTALVAADLLVSAPWPLARAPVLDTRAHEEIARVDDARRLVIDLPGEVGATMATSRYLVYQTFSRRPIPYRPDARAGTSALLGTRAFQLLALPSLYRDEPWAQAARAMARTPRDAIIRDFPGDARWVVVHRELDRGAQGVAAIEAMLTDWFGPPRVVGTHAVWDTIPARSAQPVRR